MSLLLRFTLSVMFYTNKLRSLIWLVNFLSKSSAVTLNYLFVSSFYSLCLRELSSAYSIWLFSMSSMRWIRSSFTLVRLSFALSLVFVIYLLSFSHSLVS